MKKNNLLIGAAVAGLFAVSAQAKTMSASDCTKKGGTATTDEKTQKVTCMGKDGKEMKCGGSCSSKASAGCSSKGKAGCGASKDAAAPATTAPAEAPATK